MGLVKPGTTAAPVATKTAAPAAAKEGGAAAALDRLAKGAPTETAVKKSTTGSKVSSGYKERDFDAEARGKTRCALFAAALQSPAIAGLNFKDIKGLLAFAEEAAEYGVSYSFQDQK